MGAPRVSDLTIEERAAARRLAHQRRMQRAAAAKRVQAMREKLKVALAETRERFPLCRCEISPTTTPQQLRDVGSGCTSHLGYICPRLNAVRRRMEGRSW